MLPSEPIVAWPEEIPEPLPEGRPNPAVQAWWLGRLEAAGWAKNDAARIARINRDRLWQLRASPEWVAGCATVSPGDLSQDGLQRLAQATLELAVNDIRRKLPSPSLGRYVKYVRGSQGRDRHHVSYVQWAHSHRKRTERHRRCAEEAMVFVEHGDETGSAFDLCCHLLDLPPELVRVAARRMAEKSDAFGGSNSEKGRV